MTFVLSYNPQFLTSAQGKRAASTPNGIRFYKTSKAKQEERDLLTLLTPYAPSQPMEGPLELSITLTYPWRSSTSKKVMALGRICKDTKPDCSNIVKNFEDCLSKLLFFRDDSQVASLTVRKFWGDNVGIEVTLGGLE